MAKCSIVSGKPLLIMPDHFSYFSSGLELPDFSGQDVCEYLNLWCLIYHLSLKVGEVIEVPMVLLG
jgi:hypothetical protein